MADTLEVGRNVEFPTHFVGTQNGELFLFNGVDHVTRWDGISASTHPAGIAPPSTAPTVVAMPGGGSEAADYHFYYRYLDRDGIPSNLSPIKVVTASAGDKFLWGGFEATDQERVTHIQLWRTGSASPNTLYLVATLPADATAFEDTLSDEQLRGNENQPIDNGGDGTTNLNRFVAPPARAVAISFYDRYFVAGDVVYSVGSVQVENGSKTVVGVGTAWTKAMEGRVFYVRGDNRAYVIDTVDVEAQEFDLTESYEGTTNKLCRYGIRPPWSDRQKVNYSRPLEPESMPAADNIRIQEDGDEGTALMTLRNYLYFVERRHTYQLFMSSQPSRPSHDDFPGIFATYAITRGCVNQRCWVRAGDTCYLMDYEGVYRFAGGPAEQVSAAIQDLFRDGRINFAASRWFFASHSPAEQTVRFHVSLGERYLPKHALCFNYDSNQWWIERYPWGLGGYSLVSIGGQLVPVFGGEHGRFYTPSGTLDGVRSSSRGQVSSASLYTLADSSASFSPSVVGAEVHIVSGRGKGQSRRIVAASAHTLTVKTPWRIVPDDSSVYLVGGVQWSVKLGAWRYVEAPVNNQRELEVVAGATKSPSHIDIRFYLDRSDTPVEFAAEQGARNIHTMAGSPDAVMDLQRDQTGQGIASAVEWDSPGFGQIAFNGRVHDRGVTGRWVEVELRGVQGDEPARVSSVRMIGVEA